MRSYYAPSADPVTDVRSSHATAQQPQPEPSGREPIHRQVVKDLVARMDYGLELYRSPLQAGNGRDALVDAYQEALDLCCYLKQAILERDGG